MNDLNPVGTIISKNSKEGGGEYVVIAHVNCERQSCRHVIEQREYIHPTKRHIKNGKYHTIVAWCEECGFSTYSGREIII